MFNIGPQELLLILLVALVIVGPQRLPELSRTIGRGLREFRKAQDEVKKTIRLGLDETEPTTRGGAPAANPASATAAPQAASPGPAEPAEEPPPDPAADVARTLGRGLAEIRQARREIQRTFRVDLSDRPSAPARRPGSAARTTPLPPATVPQEPPAEGGPASSPAPAEPASSEQATPDLGTPE